MMNEKKERLKGRLRAWVSAGSPNENYGFGSNWSLNIGKKDQTLKSLWLGQGAKVTGRMLGLDYGDYVKDVSQRVGAKKQFRNESEWLRNKKVNRVVTEDIVNTSLGDEFIEGGWSSGGVNTKKLKKLLGAEDWGLAVQ